MYFFISIFTSVLNIIFPPRASARLLHEVFVAGTNLSEISKPKTITISRSSSSGHPDNTSSAIEPLQITTLLPYRLPLIQACILEAKFHRNTEAHALLGDLLAYYLKNYFARENNYIKVLTEKVVLVPIPLGKKRRKERGYNQIEEIGRFAVKSQGNPSLSLDSGLLQRSRETIPQMTLGRTARLANMKDAFVVSKPLNPEVTYVLLDDVVTTGATLLAAYEALQNAGAKRILVVALAH